MAEEAVRAALKDLASKLREESDRVRKTNPGRAPGRSERELWAALDRGDAKEASRIRREAVDRGGAHLCGLPDQALVRYADKVGGASIVALWALAKEGALEERQAARLALNGIMRKAKETALAESLDEERARKLGLGVTGGGKSLEEMVARNIQEEFQAAGEADSAAGGSLEWRACMAIELSEQIAHPTFGWATDTLGEGSMAQAELARLEGERIRKGLLEEGPREPSRKRARSL